MQQSNAIESLSNVDVLCMDKTGTLTANRLQLDSVQPFAGDEADLRRVLGVMAASTASPTRPPRRSSRHVRSRHARS